MSTILEFEITTLYPDVEPCSTRSYFDSFQLGLIDFYPLWIHLLPLLASHLLHFPLPSIQKERTKGKMRLLLLRPKGKPGKGTQPENRECLFDSHWAFSFMTLRNIVNPIFHQEGRNQQEVSRETRKAEIRRKATRKFTQRNFKVKIITIFNCLLKLKRRNKRATPEKLVLKYEMHKRRSKSTAHQRLKLLYSEALKEVFWKTMSKFGCSPTIYALKIPFTNQGKGATST